MGVNMQTICLEFLVMIFKTAQENFKKPDDLHHAERIIGYDEMAHVAVTTFSRWVLGIRKLNENTW